MIAPGSAVLRVIDGGLVATDEASRERSFTADTILYDFGRVPDSEGVEASACAHPALTAIGDCEAVGVIGQAIRRGFFTAWAIGVAPSPSLRRVEGRFQRMRCVSRAGTQLSRKARTAATVKE
jgi:hypothetical protein